MSEFERIIADSMVDEDGREWFVTDDDGWGPIMGEDLVEQDLRDEWIDTDDTWLDDFQGEEDFA